MRNNIRSFLSDLIFYGVLIALVVTVLAVNGQKSSGPRVIGGYSAFVVLTGSMEDVIPKGSLVITKSVDAGELQIGDDITYMVSEKTTVTHRIIAIEEEYLTTGERAFTTKGTMNAEADRMPVAAVNVVGKVVYHSERLGAVISFGQENWPLIIFFIVVTLLFIKIITNILKKEDQDTSRPTKLAERKPVQNVRKETDRKTKQPKKLKQTKKKTKTDPEMTENNPSSRILEDEEGFVLEIIDLS